MRIVAVVGIDQLEMLISRRIVLAAGNAGRIDTDARSGIAYILIEVIT